MMMMMMTMMMVMMVVVVVVVVVMMMMMMMKMMIVMMTYCYQLLQPVALVACIQRSNQSNDEDCERHDVILGLHVTSI